MKRPERIDYEDREPKGPFIIFCVSIAACVGLVIAVLVQVGV